MATLLPFSWLPNVPMKRIHGHWTAGNHVASDQDRRAYPILVEGDGKPVRGIPSIDLNRTNPATDRLYDGYAAHTLNANSDAIGVSMCGMAGAVESPFNAGRAPLTKVQWDAFIRIVAELARFYKIPVTPKTILFHAEVEANLGIKQNAKWDVARLPFDPSIVGAKAIGDKMRREVSAILAGDAPATPQEPVPAGGIARVTAAVLNTRNGPNGDVTGSLTAGTMVEVTKVEGNWLNVITPGGWAVWVHRDHVQMVDGPPPLAPTKPSPLREKLLQIKTLIEEIEEMGV